MSKWSELFPSTLVLMGRAFFKVPGVYSRTVPAGAYFMRAVALGCGGQGDQWGGGGALARSLVAVTPGENIKVQVGTTSSASIAGDSWVRRNDNTNICYADRGRGNGNRGLASNSFGDVTRDGSPGVSGSGGDPASDLADFGTLGFGGLGNKTSGDISHSAPNAGGGGALGPAADENGIFIGYVTFGAGGGMVALEFFNENPGY